MRNPDSIAKKVLGSDPTLLWVVILNEKGETLAHVYSDSNATKVKLGKKTKERLGALDTIFLEASTRAEKWYGSMDFILLAYRKAKIMLMFSKKRGVYLATKIPRSAMAEHLYPKVRHVLDGP